MERPSEPQCRALSPWRGLLITASILSCWIQPTSARVTIVPIPPYGEVNHSVTLQIQGFLGWGITYTWFRKAALPGQKITVYTATTREQKPADIREKVLRDGSLLIPHLTLNDSADYYLTIVDSEGDTRFAQAHLAVYDGLDAPMIFPRAPHYSVGATIELNCSPESNPSPQFTWLINGIQMTSSSKLSIANVSLNHTGTYTCNASNSVTGLASNKDINKTVSERTTKPNLTVNRTNIIENDTLAFTCGTKQEGGNILWFFNKKPLIFNERMKLSMKNRTLTILSVKREDAGSYECEIWNPIDFNRSDTVNLTVNYGPDNIMFVPNPKKGEIEVKFNDPLMLECHVESYPPAQYLWQVNCTNIPDFSNNTYIIKNVTLKNSGKYTCLAKNKVTKLSVSKSITVKVDGRITKPNLTANGTNVIENDTLAFTCGTKEKGVDILWFFDEKPLILNEKMKLSMKNQTLTILSVKRENTGSYQCEIQNPISSNRSDPITLTVNYGPDNITFVPKPKKGEIEVKFNNPLMLECHVESYPPAQYLWQVNGTKIPDFSNNTYVIKNVTLKNSGKYTCLAKNKVTNLSVSKSITVKVDGRITKPNLTANRTNIIENDTFAFTCGTKEKGVDILWFFDEKPLILNEKMKLSMKNQTLTILSVKRENIGSYQCEIQNPISSNRSDPFSLTVNYGPDNIMFVPNPKKGEIEVKFNDPLMLQCNVESFPPAQYLWQVNGTKIPDFSNNTYVIKNVTLKNSGNYTCLAKNKVTNLSVSKSITVKVDGRITKPNLTANGTNVIENDTLAFTCGTKEKGVDILWFFDEKPLILNEKMKLSMKNQTLTILSVKRENIGSYQCEIQNPISSNRSDPFSLTVNYGPDNITFVPKPKKGEIEVKFNNPLMLECHVESYPPAQYLWQVNGTKIPDFSNNTYVIKNVTLKNSGKYTCLAKNKVTNLSVSKSITVKVDGRITKPNLTANRTNIIENDTFAFTCGTKEKGVDILWFFDEKPLILNEKMKLSMKNQTLTILSVKRENIGSYQCEIQNPISSNRSDPFSLTVNYGPDNIMFVPNPKKGEIEVKFNDPLMLQCNVESFPPAQYLWQVNGTKIPDFSNNTYVIKNVTLKNSGNYTCLAKNKVTNLSVSKSITVKVDGRITKPNLTANGTNIIENDTLAFTCGTKEKGVDILWFFDEKPLILNEKMKLSMKNQTLTILSLKREDAGSYQCEIQNPISSNRSDPFSLTVNYGPDNIMFVPNPKKGEIEVKFNDPLMLQCNVESFPPAQYLWQVNDTKIPDFSNNTYVIKNVTLKNSGNYTCLAKNKVTNLSVSKSITVKVDAQSAGGSSSLLTVGVITGIVIGVLAVIILIGTLIYIHIRKTGRDAVTREVIPQWTIN